MDFTAVELRIGITTDAGVREGGLHLTLDVGSFGERRTASQIHERYAPEGLVGRQAAVVMTPPGRGAETMVVLAAVGAEEGAVLPQPKTPLPNGTRVVWRCRRTPRAAGRLAP